MATKTTTQPPKIDMYQKVTDRIIALLEADTPPWRCTWSRYGMPRNYASMHGYKGINALLLAIAPFPIPYFLTMKQANGLGGKVKKGSKAEQVMYYNMTYKDKDGNKLTYDEANKQEFKDIKVLKYLKYYNVFNVDDIEGIDFAFPEITIRENEVIERCDALLNSLKNMPEFVTTDGSRCFYVPSKDVINVVPMSQFESSESYYNTAFHELIHGTGHESRLARPGITESDGFGKKKYSEEELIAEIGASFLAGITGIDRASLMENNAAYIQGWLGVLKEDKRFVFRAAAAAQKGVDFMLQNAPDFT